MIRTAVLTACLTAFILVSLSLTVVVIGWLTRLP